LGRNSAAGIHPTGVDLLLLHPFQGQPDGLAAIQKLLGDNGPDAIVLADHRVAQAPPDRGLAILAGTGVIKWIQ
jgi:hypothetical protein